MIYDDDELALDGEREEEPRELPEVTVASAPCTTCGKLEQFHGCFRCGKSVCMDEQQYMADTDCGAWILDWWSNGAMNPDDGNEYWCQACLREVYEQQLPANT